MKRLILIFIILSIDIYYSQSKIFAFVGKKISIEKVKSENSFYLKYKNVYKVEQVFDHEIKTDTLIFNSYTHMNQIRYSVYDYAMIYLIKNEAGEFVHQRTYYTPIILKKDGQWYGFNGSDKDVDGYEKINNKPLNIRKNLMIGKTVFTDKIKNKWLMNTFYPEKFFKRICKNKVEIKYLKTAEKLFKSN
ncbi:MULTISPECIES: hypothetical protein [Chryseobacterium]|jgi:hypothetical protein|uniref:Uncharacterized protein n=1 Tax=Chryseobacterium aquaticum TaxID=452084 RepID=A0A0Q3LVT6_9FLAO|nr:MULTISPECIES: hypothetical protein [Chryseobacterium]KNB61277.1 hypothetical protein AC804_11980 [Chryseobacterium sp. Hurlbut01]KQK27473.1 hypothetical protein AR438_00020 [Chryseobacterium aquaticum]